MSPICFPHGGCLVCSFLGVLEQEGRTKAKGEVRKHLIVNVGVLFECPSACHCI